MKETNIPRTHRYKPLSIISMILNTTSHLLVFFTWRHGANTPASLSVFVVGLAHGLVISTQFIGMSARASKAQVASAVSTYYLCQELGMIVGASSSAALEGGIFRGQLEGNIPGDGTGMKNKVSVSGSPYGYGAHIGFMPLHVIVNCQMVAQVLTRVLGVDHQRHFE